MEKKLVLIFAVIVVVIVGVAIFLSPGGPEGGAYDGFAACLAEKKVVMYGAYSCPHCQNEKKRFGDSFRLVPYVECTEETEKCVAAGIEGYPTWIFGDGRRFEGEQGLQRLSQESGCLLP
ncbi:MAG: hypothetical protein V2A55_02355 [Candidatus Jorgensenbacteria bacterium]